MFDRIARMYELGDSGAPAQIVDGRGTARYVFGMGDETRFCEMTAQICERAESLGGVAVLSVMDRGRAAKAGIRRGDVVLEVDGHDVRSLDDYVAAIGSATMRPTRILLERWGTLLEARLA